MKITVDNQVVRLFSGDADRVLRSPVWTKEGSYLDFNWSSLFEYLELGQLFTTLPAFDPSRLLFTASISALCEVENPEDLFYIYDSLFTEMLKEVKALSEIDAVFLLKRIEEKKGALSGKIERILFPALTFQERILRENAPHAMHDLVLYLAWDRMCVCMARLFDYQSAHPKYLQNLKNLKWCLIESFQHIASQKRTCPSFYRMMEALFYYQMREEHLQLHPEADWELLSQSFPLLKSPNELVDYFYIDHTVVPASQSEPSCHLTLDSPETIQCRLDLAHYMISRLQQEIPKWSFTLGQPHIVHL